MQGWLANNPPKPGDFLKHVGGVWVKVMDVAWPSYVTVFFLPRCEMRIYNYYQGNGDMEAFFTHILRRETLRPPK